MTGYSKKFKMMPCEKCRKRDGAKYSKYQKQNERFSKIIFTWITRYKIDYYRDNRV